MEKPLYVSKKNLMMIIMVKRKGNPGKTRYRTRTVKSYVRGAKSKAGGLFSGLVAGAGGSLLGRFIGLGAWTQPVADIGTGYFMKNETLTTIGGRSIGAMLVSGMGGGAAINGSNAALLQ